MKQKIIFYAAVIITLLFPGLLQAQKWINGPSTPTHAATVPKLVEGSVSGAYETKDITVDINNNVYVCGYFKGTFSGFTAQGEDGFIAKYNNAGVLQYLVVLNGTRNDVINAIESDPWGNIYFTGSYTGASVQLRTVFPTLSSPYTISMASLNTTSHACMGRLMVNGAPHWAQRVNAFFAAGCGPSFESSGLDVSIDFYNSVPVAVFTGYTTTNTQFTRGVRTGCLATADISINNPFPNDLVKMGYVVQYTDCGRLNWAKLITPGSAASFSVANSVKFIRSSVYPNHNGVFVCGNYSGANTFVGSTNINVNTPAARQHGFVARLNGNTGNAEWVSTMDGDTVTARKVDITFLGNDVEPIVAGEFSGGIANLNNGIQINPADAARDVYVARFNYNGTAQWGRSAGGPLNDSVNGLAVGKTSEGGIYLTGSYKRSFSIGTKLVSAYGGNLDEDNHLFVAKFDHYNTAYWVNNLTYECSGGASAGTGICVNQAGTEMPYVTGTLRSKAYLNYLNPGSEVSLQPANGNPASFFACHYSNLCENTPPILVNVRRISPTQYEIRFMHNLPGPYTLSYREKNTTVYPSPLCYDNTVWDTKLYNIAPGTPPGLYTDTITVSNSNAVYEWGMQFMAPCGTFGNVMPISGLIYSEPVWARTSGAIGANEILPGKQPKVYPVPVGNEVHVVLPGNVKDGPGYQVVITNNNGQTLYRAAHTALNGTLTIPAKQLQPGVYSCIIRYKGQVTATVKLVK